MNNDLFQQLEDKAKSNPQKIAFPESNNEYILKAAEQLVIKQLGTPVVIGNPDKINELAKQIGVNTDGFTIYDNTNDTVKENMASDYCKKYTDFSEKAVKRKCKDAVNYAMFLLKMGVVDGVAAGREYTTADVIISAQSIVGLEEGFQNVSSLGILNIPDYEGPQGSMLAIADCAVTASPDADALADIAISSADTVHTLLGWEPKVAMLSFSTCGSSEHESIDTIRNAIEIAKKRKPDLKIDGEFQLDAAIVPTVASKKVKRESEVAGKANVLIFPNLHAGNIGVKIFQNFGHADAYGPVLQGFAKPVCDFSRSAPLSEMMGNIIMLIIRAQAKKQKEEN